MWHRRAIRPVSARGRSGTNRLRNVASQDDPPCWSQRLTKNEPSTECGIARRLFQKIAEEQAPSQDWHCEITLPQKHQLLIVELPYGRFSRNWHRDRL